MQTLLNYLQLLNPKGLLLDRYEFTHTFERSFYERLLTHLGEYLFDRSILHGDTVFVDVERDFEVRFVNAVCDLTKNEITVKVLLKLTGNSVNGVRVFMSKKHFINTLGANEFLFGAKQVFFMLERTLLNLYTEDQVDVYNKFNSIKFKRLIYSEGIKHCYVMACDYSTDFDSVVTFSKVRYWITSTAIVRLVSCVLHTNYVAFIAHNSKIYEIYLDYESSVTLPANLSIPDLTIQDYFIPFIKNDKHYSYNIYHVINFLQNY